MGVAFFVAWQRLYNLYRRIKKIYT